MPFPCSAILTDADLADMSSRTTTRASGSAHRQRSSTETRAKHSSLATRRPFAAPVASWSLPSVTSLPGGVARLASRPRTAIHEVSIPRQPRFSHRRFICWRALECGYRQHQLPILRHTSCFWQLSARLPPLWQQRLGAHQPVALADPRHMAANSLTRPESPNKTDAGNGSYGICRVSNVLRLRSPSPDPSR